MEEDRDETPDRLSEAIRGVLGEYTPFVIAYDSAGIDPDAEEELCIFGNPHQRHYVTEGLLHSALSYESDWSDDDDTP